MKTVTTAALRQRLPTRSFRVLLFLSLLASHLLTGCSRGPAPIRPPAYDAATAASEAMEVYDADTDGHLDKSELAQCPGILKSLNKFDANGDGQVSEGEIVARIEQWRTSHVGIQQVSFRVTLNGKPLRNGAVTLEPEPFLQDIIHDAKGVIGSTGMASPSVAAEHLPEGVRQGLRCGIYKLRITHPEEEIPPRYNSNTELGLEIGPDLNIYNPPSFELRSKK
ncbi:MAG: hypothetical protein AAGD11_11185 [Planctomycetota bacterium]